MPFLYSMTNPIVKVWTSSRFELGSPNPGHLAMCLAPRTNAPKLKLEQEGTILFEMTTTRSWLQALNTKSTLKVLKNTSH